jgi:hypothetical protein
MAYKVLLTGFVCVLLRANSALAGDIIDVQFDALPAAVKTTVLGILQQKEISKISQINDNGLLRFEIEADKTENNKAVTNWQLVVADNGKLMKLAKQVPYYTLTYPQMQIVEKRYPHIKVTEAESVDIHFFELIGNVDGKAVKFRLYEDGLIEELPEP